jgi:hypothetical protein
MFTWLCGRIFNTHLTLLYTHLATSAACVDYLPQLYYYSTFAQSYLDIFPKQCHLFSEPDRQNNGKACILSDTTRMLKDLLSQVESLRKENNTLKNESHYVSVLLSFLKPGRITTWGI